VEDINIVSKMFKFDFENSSCGSCILIKIVFQLNNNKLRKKKIYVTQPKPLVATVLNIKYF